MGAFWDAWNRQGAANNADAMAGMQQAQGLAALMKQGQDMQMQQGIRGILSSNQAPEAKLQGLMQFGPAGIQVASQMAQMQGQQAKLAEETRLRELRPKLQAMFTTPAVEPEMGPPVPGSVLNPGAPASFDDEGYVRRAATEGLIPTEAALNHLATNRTRRDALLQQETLKREAAAALERENQARRDQQNLVLAEGQRNRLAAIEAARAGRAPAAAPAITPVTVADDKDPTGVATKIIDGRTGRELGKGPKMTQAGAADQKMMAGLPAARTRVASMTQNIDKLDEAIAELETAPGLSNITGTLAGRTPNLTNDATNAQAKLDSIKAQVFVNALQSMREASKTGGAVGNVSDREGDKLENTLAALKQSQSTEEFKKQLGKARQQLRISREIIKNAFDEQYGAVQQGGNMQPSGGGWSVVR